MEEYYNESDFEEFTEFFDQPTFISLDEFLKSLNYVLKEKESVCDFHLVMTHIKKISTESYSILKKLTDYNRTLSVYFCIFI